MHTGQPLFRAFRAIAFAAVCAAASLGVHRLAGGAPVQPGTLALAVGLTAGGGYLLAGHRRGLGALLGACFATQYGLHHLFGMGAVPERQAMPMHHHGMAHEMPVSTAEHVSMEPEMLLVHAVLALVCAWWLAQGEHALGGLLLGAAVAVGHWLIRLVTAAPTVPALPRPRGLTFRYSPAPALLLLLSAAVSRRGPPAPSCS
ncbi:hypothetical protein F4556_001453 [Kitasatospora gansuensis]|uniref:Uncharacterized protein n=1 Tax=Kitasatospora gansuensis TaxID=258050 RepID=A0A7W7S8N0_9ACTN|nr:hypothetical protein [Kitasatospora gansuensis]MBB4945918.1 hypothetical protein [Kitasatospora gansuensis]